MRIRILVEITESNQHSFGIGCIVNRGDLRSFEYYWPSNMQEAITSAGQLLAQDVRRVLSSTVKYSNLLLTSCKYRIMEAVYFYEGNKRMCRLTLMAVSLIAVSQILSSSRQQQLPSFTNTTLEYRNLEVENESTYTIPVKDSKVASQSLKVPSKRVVRKSTAVKKPVTKRDTHITPRLPVKEISHIQSIADIQLARTNVNELDNGVSVKHLKTKRMFSSRADAILGLYQSYKALGFEKDINILTSIAQFLFESGLSEDGRPSLLASNANNFFGIKSGVYSHTLKKYVHYPVKGAVAGQYVVTGDDEYINGKKIGSHFAVFSNVEDGLKGHHQFLLKDRYERVRKHAGVSFKSALKACDALYVCGYFTSSDAVKGLQNNVRLVAKTLKAAGVTLEP